MIKVLKCLNVENNVCFPTHIKMECFIFLGVNGSSKLQLYGIHGYQAESSCYSSFEWDFLCEWGTATEHTWTFRWMETAWWFGTWIWWLSIQLGISSSQLTSCHIFQRGRSTKPPTRKSSALWYFTLWKYDAVQPKFASSIQRIGACRSTRHCSVLTIIGIKAMKKKEAKPTRQWSIVASIYDCLCIYDIIYDSNNRH